MTHYENNLLREIINGIPELVLVVSEKGKYLEIGGVSEHNPNDVIDKSLYELFPERVANLFKNALHDAFTSVNQEMKEIEYQLSPSPDLKIAFPYNETRSFQLKINPLSIKYKNDRIAVCICRDITELRNYEKKLMTLAERDPLTDVYNRNKLYEHLEISFKELSLCNTTICFMLLDIDDLKIINDTHGHLAGDKAICHFANVCKQALRANDIFARLGGDEFGLIMKATSRLEAGHIALKIRTLITEKTFSYEGNHIDISASIGISEISPYDKNAEKVILKADQAMYQSKNKGKNKISVYNELIEDVPHSVSANFG